MRGAWLVCVPPSLVCVPPRSGTHATATRWFVSPREILRTCLASAARRVSWERRPRGSGHTASCDAPSGCPAQEPRPGEGASRQPGVVAQPSLGAPPADTRERGDAWLDPHSPCLLVRWQNCREEKIASMLKSLKHADSEGRTIYFRVSSGPCSFKMV